jgi:hypothetical protein
VEIYWGSETLHARVSDISIAGLFLELSTPLWIGATFSAKLMLKPPLQLNCTVRRVVPNRGMGVHVAFTDSETCIRFAKELGKLGQ